MVDFVLNHSPKSYLNGQMQPTINVSDNGVTAVILAGGESRRMKQDKSLISIHGVPLIQSIFHQLSTRFEKIVISANDPQKYAFMNCLVIPDETPHVGPLMAIQSVLKRLQEPIFVVATDIPEIPWTILNNILALERQYPDCQAIVPITSTGEYEPLFAIYRPEIIGTIAKALQENQRHIYGIFAEIPVAILALKEDETIPNLNHPEDFERYVENQ